MQTVSLGYHNSSQPPQPPTGAAVTIGAPIDRGVPRSIGRECRPWWRRLAPSLKDRGVADPGCGTHGRRHHGEDQLVTSSGRRGHSASDQIRAVIGDTRCRNGLRVGFRDCGQVACGPGCWRCSAWCPWHLRWAWWFFSRFCVRPTVPIRTIVGGAAKALARRPASPDGHNYGGGPGRRFE